MTLLLPPIEPPSFGFAEPLWLFALALLPVVAWRAWQASRVRVTLRTSAVTAGVRALPVSWRQRLAPLPLALRIAALACLIVALARPQDRNVVRMRTAEGIDIVIALDTSTSMEALDFTPNRFAAARDVALRFIASRTDDRVGLVVFAGKAFTQAPLTLDTDFVVRMLASTRTGMIEDGTAIGSALTTSIARLRGSTAASKVVILITDGQNNRGEVDPRTAAEIARTVGVRVYAIGVGTEGEAPFVFQTPLGPQQQMVDVDIDDEMLTAVAERTGGRYFRATTASALESIYDEIGQMERSALDDRVYTDVAERFPLWVGFGLLLLLAERLLAATVFRRFP